MIPFQRRHSNGANLPHHFQADLLCFIAETRECLHNWFRSGDAYSANDCAEFIKECFTRLPERVRRLYVRGDSAFFNGELLDCLEENLQYESVNLGKS